MISFFFEHYLITALVAVSFIIFIQCDCMDTRRTTSNFTWAAVCVLLLIFAETAEEYYASLATPSTLRVIFAALGYTARPAIAFFLALVPAYRINNQKLTRVMIAMLIINSLIAFSALFSPIAFSFSSDNHFHRGPLGFTSFAVGAVYLVILVYYCFKRIRHGEKVDSIICGSGTIICGIAVFIEYEFSYRCILPALAIYGEIFYFMYLLMTKYSTDYLTGAYVRSHLYKEVEARNCDRYYITFDVNGLKRINDRNGHAAGDAALTAFSEAAYSCMPPTTSLFYRLGGDEFAIIYRTASSEDVENLISRIKEKCTAPYGISSGFAPFTGATDFEEAAIAADAMLYADKKAFWKKYEAEHPQEF